MSTSLRWIHVGRLINYTANYLFCCGIYTYTGDLSNKFASAASRPGGGKIQGGTRGRGNRSRQRHTVFALCTGEVPPIVTADEGNAIERDRHDRAIGQL